jgi:hypothetical protein
VGLYDNGNSDAMTLSTFDANTGKLTGTVANLFLGSKIKEKVWYRLQLEFCSAGGDLFGSGRVVGVNLPLETLPFDVSLPAGISPFGQVGIAGYAKSSFVDSSVRYFSSGIDN